jgi:hypothetical protein
MTWLEGSTLGHLMRDSGVWTYGLVNLSHILGVAVLFGSVLILDLRLMGAWRQIPLSLITRPTVTMASIGFAVAAASGAGLLATKATDYIGNPFFYVKYPAIALALFNIYLVHRTKAWRAHRERDLMPPEKSQLARMGAVSLVFWLIAVSAGRMIGYW